MDAVLGGLAGLVTGVLGSLVAAIVQIAGKRVRDLRRVRHGVPSPGDVVFTPYWPLFGMLGFIAGVSWTWRLGGTWITGAVAGLGVPAVATLIFLGWVIAQIASFRRPPPGA